MFLKDCFKVWFRTIRVNLYKGRIRVVSFSIAAVIVFSCVFVSIPDANQASLELLTGIRGVHDVLSAGSSNNLSVPQLLTVRHLLERTVSDSVHTGDNLLTPLLGHFRKFAGRSDNSRKFWIHDFAASGENWYKASKEGVVCLASHTSLEKMASLVEVSEAWQGLVSVALFVPGTDFSLVLLIVAYFRRCFETIRNNASFHAVYPISDPPILIELNENELDSTLNCSDVQSSVNTIINLRYGRRKVKTLYPQNHLRNVARKDCQTKFVFLTDVDIIPRRNLSDLLSHFLRNVACDKCAFVIPTYELDYDVIVSPSNKSELIKLVKKRKARQYRKIAYNPNQKATNSKRWEDIKESKFMNVSYKLNYTLYYEPFYVSSDDVPVHDERFIGYGFTRNTQVYEMVKSGYTLYVLNNAFALHRGFASGKIPTWRKNQTDLNRRLYKKFREELEVKYKRTPRNKKSRF